MVCETYLIAWMVQVKHCPHNQTYTQTKTVISTNWILNTPCLNLDLIRCAYCVNIDSVTTIMSHLTFNLCSYVDILLFIVFEILASMESYDWNTQFYIVFFEHELKQKASSWIDSLQTVIAKSFRRTKQLAN